MKEQTHIIKLLKKASQEPAFLERLEFFHKYDKKPLQRWENWLQMELLYFLHKQGVEELSFEDRISRDKRRRLSSSATGFYSASIDIVYKRKSSLQNLYTALELKVGDHPECSIKGSIVDLERIGCLISRGWYFSSVFSISIYRHKESSKYIELVKNKGIIMDFGPYKAAILGWESINKSESSLREYQGWLEELKYPTNY